jgi:hypothetical protein
MTQIATYNQARSLAHALGVFNIAVKPETFEMTTSGIYIPRWIGYSRIPHEFDPITGTAQWYFFFRFVNTATADINVGEALDFQAGNLASKGMTGMKALVAHIKSNQRIVKA